MKKHLSVCLAVLLFLFLSACTPGEEKAPETRSPTVVRTFEINENEHIWVTYYEMSDGTWRTDKYTYQYCLVLEDAISGTDYTAQYTVLSNRDDLTFHQVFLASGISSSTSDYFLEEDAVIVRSSSWKNEQ